MKIYILFEKVLIFAKIWPAYYNRINSTRSFNSLLTRHPLHIKDLNMSSLSESIKLLYLINVLLTMFYNLTTQYKTIFTNQRGFIVPPPSLFGKH